MNRTTVLQQGQDRSCLALTTIGVHPIVVQIQRNVSFSRSAHLEIKCFTIFRRILSLEVRVNVVVIDVGQCNQGEPLLEIREAHKEFTIVLTGVWNLTFIVFCPFVTAVIPGTCVGFVGPRIAHVDETFNDAAITVSKFVNSQHGVSVALHESVGFPLSCCSQSIVLCISIFQQIPELVLTILLRHELLAWRAGQNPHRLSHPAKTNLFVVDRDLCVDFL